MALPYFFLPDSDDSFDGSPWRRQPVSAIGRGDGLPESSADRARVARVRVGDEAEFGSMFRELHVPLCEFATTYVHDGSLAEELVQEVFLDLWVRRAQWSPERGIRAYLFRAVRNRATDAVRHARIVEQVANDSRGEPVGMGSPPASPATDAGLHELSAALRVVIDQLPTARRRAALLRWRHGLSYAEIGEAMGISVASATMHVARAREAVRPVMERFTLG